MHRYGLSLEALPELVAAVPSHAAEWGRRTIIAREPEYDLERLDFDSAGSSQFSVRSGAEATLFVEQGRLKVGEHLLQERDTFTIGPRRSFELRADTPTALYIFSGPASGEVAGWPRGTLDRREKYWGTIETVVNNRYTGKRLFFRKGQHSSLHFHCQKSETYFIHSGRLLVRLRAGRGEDEFFELVSGQTLSIPPGLMHQDGAIEDTVVIEVSTHDEDADSFIVEDGQLLPMPRLGHGRHNRSAETSKVIVFDLDGCLCTRTEGDYENAKPIESALALVNKLHGEGYKIVINTARFMGRNQGDALKAHAEGYEFTRRQLAGWGVKYHELRLGKPPAHVVVDDRAAFFEPDWVKIEADIRRRLS
ncbi:hypothetical protein HYW67_00450 [Candidatus Parcubacteria bacterium]|nr:hypothetical protein [Candidatus Parcubacteria bacterium]